MEHVLSHIFTTWAWFTPYFDSHQHAWCIFSNHEHVFRKIFSRRECFTRYFESRSRFYGIFCLPKQDILITLNPSSLFKSYFYHRNWLYAIIWHLDHLFTSYVDSWKKLNVIFWRPYFYFCRYLTTGACLAPSIQYVWMYFAILWSPEHLLCHIHSRGPWFTP